MSGPEVLVSQINPVLEEAGGTHSSIYIRYPPPNPILQNFKEDVNFSLKLLNKDFLFLIFIPIMPLCKELKSFTYFYQWSNTKLWICLWIFKKNFIAKLWTGLSGWILRENGLAALFFSQVCLAVHRDGHSVCKQTKFSRTNETFRVQWCGSEKKRTIKNRWCKIVLTNLKNDFFKQTVEKLSFFTERTILLNEQFYWKKDLTEQLYWTISPGKSLWGILSV